jgi:hypothetical protein
MICGFVLVALLGATVYRLIRGRDIKPLLFLWALFSSLFAGTCALALVEFEESSKITECRAPLVGDSTCTGFNDSWTECRWAFRAEGRPAPDLCERFLQLPAGYQGSGETADYDDVRSLSEVECRAWGLSSGNRCFAGTRHDHEATNRYLLSFSPDCTASIVLRSCNQDLEVVAPAEAR